MRGILIPMDDSDRLTDEVAQAIASNRPINIRGGDTKSFLARCATPEAMTLDTRSHSGIVRYDPSELVMTARAGTPMSEVSKVLDAAGQMLPCEPPEFSGSATLGGVVASGLSGPRRPWSGSVRDFMLGCRLITGRGKHLRFGGEVMKNVAGYDMSRLAAGSFGCLGVITEVSIKVLPKPRARRSIVLELAASEAMVELSRWRRTALPITGACYLDGRLHVRLEGGEGSVQSALDRIGGDALDMSFWTALRERELPFFGDPRTLWRLSLPNATPLMSLPGDAALDWGGAQRWLKTSASSTEIRWIAHGAGGHATRYGPPDTTVNPFAPLAEPLVRLHRELKKRLDPHGVFNPGRLYADV